MAYFAASLGWIAVMLTLEGIPTTVQVLGVLMLGLLATFAMVMLARGFLPPSK